MLVCDYVLSWRDCRKCVCTLEVSKQGLTKSLMSLRSMIIMAIHALQWAGEGSHLWTAWNYRDGKIRMFVRVDQGIRTKEGGSGKTEEKVCAHVTCKYGCGQVNIIMLTHWPYLDWTTHGAHPCRGFLCYMLDIKVCETFRTREKIIMKVTK